MRCIHNVKILAVIPLLLVVLSPPVVPAGGAVEYERIDPSHRGSENDAHRDTQYHCGHDLQPKTGTDGSVQVMRKKFE